MTKRTSPFKSAGASVQSTTGRRAAHISLQGLYCSCKPVFCSHVTLTGYPLHSRFPFTSPPVRHCVPSHFKSSLPQIYIFCIINTNETLHKSRFFIHNRNNDTFPKQEICWGHPSSETLRCITSQNSKDLSYTIAEVWHLARNVLSSVLV